MSRLDREKWRQKTRAAYPHQVDLTSPTDGYGSTTEKGIMKFLESRIGTFDLFVEVQDGVPFVKYCFERQADAESFYVLFGPSAEKAVLKKVG